MENWLTQRASLTPQQLAVVTTDEQVTFSDLRQRVTHRCQQLATIGVQAGETVGIVPANTLTSYITILAVQQVGAIPVLLNFRLPAPDLTQQLRTAQATVLLMDDAYRQGHTTVPGPWASYWLQEVAQRPEQPVTILSEFRNEAVASIMYTSGTTGTPHAVQQTFGNHFYSAIGTFLNLGLTAQDRWLLSVPLFHISGLSIMMRSLIGGLTVQLVAHFDAAEINHLLATEPVTLMSVVPYMLKKLLGARRRDYQSAFRCFLLGGGPIDRATLSACQAAQLPVVQSYGMTETASQVVALTFADAARKLGSVGKPLFPVQLRVQAKPGDVGAIEVKSPTLTPGYLGDDVGYATKLTPDGWFKTGDLGYLDTDGFLYVQGREGDMIITGGENVFPDQVEAAYATAPGVDEIAVVGVPDDEWGQVPVAYVVAQEPIDPSALRTFGRAQLAHYQVPKRFIQVAQLPKTASGKVQRHQLRQR